MIKKVVNYASSSVWNFWTLFTFVQPNWLKYRLGFTVFVWSSDIYWAFGVLVLPFTRFSWCKFAAAEGCRAWSVRMSGKGYGRQVEQRDVLSDNDYAVDQNLTTAHILLDFNSAQRKNFGRYADWYVILYIP